MQYNTVVNQNIANKNQNVCRQDANTISNGSTSSMGNGGRGAINNIFSRNVMNSSASSNNPLISQANFMVTSTSNNLNKPTTPTLNFGLGQTNNIVASNKNNSGVMNTAANPFIKAPASTSNNFGVNNSLANVFNANTAQTGKNNISIFNNNSNSNTVSNPPSSFNKTQNQKPFTQQFTNNPTINSFQAQNIQKPMTSKPIDFQTTNNLNQNANNNPVTSHSNPFTNPNFNNNQRNSTGIQNHLFTASLKCQTSNQFPQQNMINQAQISQLASVQNNAASESQVQRLMERMNLNHFKTWNNPYNFYHTQLMLENLYSQIDKRYKERPKFIKKQYYTKVKDSPYKNHILFIIKEMIETSEYIDQQRKSAIQLDKKADKLAQSLKSKLATSKLYFIRKLKFERMVKQMETELYIIEGEIFNLLKPLLQAYEANRHISFDDPDSFSIEIAKTILAKICMIQKNINQLAAQSTNAFFLITSLDQQNSLEAKRAISQLMIYFEEICIKFQVLKEKYDSYQVKPNEKKKQNDHKVAQQCHTPNEMISKIRKALSNRSTKIEKGFSKN